MSTELDADPHVGRVLHGIELKEVIGTGQTARVYRGVHAALGEQRAVKILLDDLADPVTEERFLREVRAIRAIEHNHVVRLLDAGRTEEGQGFLVLEWLDGLGLDRLIAARAPFPPRRVARILKQLASALSAAHAAQLVHRDLKPANVMVVENPESGEEVKLIDFGLVRVENSKLTAAGVWLGTPAYLAPEVRLGDAPSPRADLFALGVIGYEMMSGKLPFGDSGLVPTGGPSPALLPTDSGLEPIVFSLLAADPSGRPESAAALIAAIDAMVWKRDQELDTLIQPTDLSAAEDELSTATDPSGRRATAITKARSAPPPSPRLPLTVIAALLLAAFCLAAAALLRSGPRPAEPAISPPSAPSGPVPIQREPSDPGR